MIHVVDKVKRKRLTFQKNRVETQWYSLLSLGARAELSTPPTPMKEFRYTSARVLFLAIEYEESLCHSAVFTAYLRFHIGRV